MKILRLRAMLIATFAFFLMSITFFSLDMFIEYYDYFIYGTGYPPIIHGFYYKTVIIVWAFMPAIVYGIVFQYFRFRNSTFNWIAFFLSFIPIKTIVMAGYATYLTFLKDFHENKGFEYPTFNLIATVYSAPVAGVFTSLLLWLVSSPVHLCESNVFIQVIDI